MEQLRAMLGIPALILWGIVWRLRHPGESEESYLVRTYPGTTVIEQHRHDDFLD